MSINVKKGELKELIDFAEQHMDKWFAETPTHKRLAWIIEKFRGKING